MAVWLSCLLAILPLFFQGGFADFDETKVTFFLYKNGSGDNPEQLSLNTLGESSFDPEIPTAMFIHGYGSGHLKMPAQTIKNAILSVKNANVILVDYAPLAFPYRSLYANARNIGKTSAGLINALLQEKNLDLEDFGIIGHSFGAHISGFTANSVNGRVKRIFGLDPAGPLFKHAEPINRLSNDDADYVVCIHTSPILGINKAICTVDFFPNGGENQPGCANFDDTELLFGACSHQIAINYFSDAFKSPKIFPASICLSDFAAKSTTGEKLCAPTGVSIGSAIFGRILPGSYYVTV